MFLPATNAYYTAFAGSFSCTFFRVTSEKACASLTPLTSFASGPRSNEDQQRKQRRDAWLFWASVTGLRAWNWENASANLLYLTNACFTNERISQSKPPPLKCQDLSRCQNDERLQILSRRYISSIDALVSFGFKTPNEPWEPLQSAQCVQAT